MKTIVYKQVYWVMALLVLFLSACTPSKAEAKEVIDGKTQSISISDPRKALGELGFYVFPEPVSLPDFMVEALSGENLLSSSLTGTVTLLNFWATWCPPCRKEMPSIESLYKKMEGTNFRIVAVSASEKRADVEKFIAAQKYSFPIYLDERGSISSSLASQGIPTTYILDKNGLVIAGLVGAREYDDDQLIEIFKELAK